MTDATHAGERPVPGRRAAIALFSAFLLLNLFDALSTLWMVRNGGAKEANPLMIFLLAHGAAAFLAGKMLLANTFMLALLAYRRVRAAWAAAACLTGIYVLLAFWHVYCLMLIAPS